MAADLANVTVTTPVPAQVVGNAFVNQYYHILHHSPGLVYQFYQDSSKIGRPENDGSMSITTTMQAINEKILSLNYEYFIAELNSVDTQESLNGGFHVLVTGHLKGNDHSVRNFAQSFVLAPQDRGYFVLNDMFRYVNVGHVNAVVANGAVVPSDPEPILSPIQENRVSELSNSGAEKATEGEVYNPHGNGVQPRVEEDSPAAEVDEVENSEVVVVSSSKTEDVPKKSYASIVMHPKESAASFSPPQVTSLKTQSKNMELSNQPSTLATDGSVSSPEAAENGKNQESEGDGYSIYLKGLPMNASDFMLGEVFKNFGTIKSNGIQVRSKRQQGVCFGFVEFEEENSMHKALEASPVLIGGCQVVVEEKRSTNSRGHSRGRFQHSGFRNEGFRGRGNYGGYRGFNRVDDGRSEFVNRGGYRRGSFNRDGYQRPGNMNSNGGRMNRGGDMVNGNAKNTSIPATS